jgi:hypothetical protein
MSIVLHFTYRIFSMNRWLFIITGVTLLFLPACQSQESNCQWATGTPRYMVALPSEISTIESSDPSQTPGKMEIGGKNIIVDKVVEGPLCNDTWSGTVYVTCDVQVFAWEEEPTFLKDCNLSIEPGSVVYVAYHNDTAYYNGCSCHTGEITPP